MGESSALAVRSAPSLTSPLHFVVRPIPYGEAKAFIEHWHYSRRMPTGKNASYGLFEGGELSGDLYAVIIVGLGVNAVQSESLEFPKGTVWEIKRMARSEPKRAFPLSRFIAEVRRDLRRTRPHVLALVAFADPAHGHVGGVYGAAGFRFDGMTGETYHVVDKAGNLRHRLVAHRMARRKGISIAEARKALGFMIVRTEPKHRWLYVFERQRMGEGDEIGRFHEGAPAVTVTPALRPATELSNPDRMRARLLELEDGIRTGFVRIGNALIEIHDARLYQAEGFRGFAGYCRDRLQLSRAHAYRLMDAAREAILSPIGDPPKNEWQARQRRRARLGAGRTAKPRHRRPVGTFRSAREIANRLSLLTQDIVASRERLLLESHDEWLELARAASDLTAEISAVEKSRDR